MGDETDEPRAAPVFQSFTYSIPHISSRSVHEDNVI
jgi:hypothetical protein